MNNLEKYKRLVDYYLKYSDEIDIINVVQQINLSVDFQEIIKKRNEKDILKSKVDAKDLIIIDLKDLLKQVKEKTKQIEITIEEIESFTKFNDE